ncbi:hypothetical protein I302_106294 [Kwoniella bestiolae CBS 10118]|uniref:Uncharacterized protein n=1 Tax=Kwoniella bestiolae CBS 10118 TaxID=1296100 RepID=A0A1B9G3G4_9TREE|nr:hypothetical protein I302_05417 [Kwoniella bestiolae CBS 10118]OCF25597.1 hypothetical protein I302_05417 [Kwoniella bestiolae CBS 10118]
MSKTQQNWETEERKLQSVYDDISSHRLTSAQSTITRHLKKSPKSQPALILKLYIQQKNGISEEELLGLYDQIKGMGEMSGRGVWWVGLVFRNMGRTDLALQLYNDLSEKHPDSPQLLEQVFLHAAADENTELIVKTSRKMYSMTRDERWARLSAWSEWVKNAPQPTPSQPFPPPSPNPTSLKMATLLLNTCKSPSTSEGLWLKLQILLSAGSPEEALKFLQNEGREGGLVRLWWRMEGVRESLTRLEEGGKDCRGYWEEERGWVEGLLRGDKDSQRNYAFYRHLLLCTEHLSSKPEQLNSTYELLISLEEQIGSKERAPSLARLEIQSILRKPQVQSDLVLDDEKWLEAVEKYWVQWGSKGSIVSELEGIVGDDAQRKWLVEGLMTRQASRKHSDEQSFREQVNASIYLIRQKSRDWVVTMREIEKYWELYLSGIQYGKNLPKTDVRPADQIGLVTVCLLIELWSVTKDDVAVLYKAVLCLEKIVKDSPACSHARYLLIRLYRLIGVPSLVSPHLTQLKLSEIQLDNLLHVFTERGACESILGGNQDLWTDHMKRSGDMYQRTSVDFPEYIKECLSNETYSKIPSIQYISSSLSKSITNHSRTIEQARLATYLSAPYGPKLLKKLDLAADEEESMDLRNWELISEIGGNRPLVRDMTALGGRVEGGWVRAFGGMYRDVARFSQGEEVEEKEMSVDGLLPCEAALVKSARTLLDLAVRALKSSDEIPLTELEVIFQENIQQVKSAASRWDQIQALICLYELTKIYDLVLNKLIEINKPLKGKKKLPVLVAFINDLKIVKEKLQKEGLSGVHAKIDEMKGDEIDWERFSDSWIEDKDFVRDLVEGMNKARREVAGGIRGLLGGK